jgi:hypothetical protein
MACGAPRPSAASASAISRSSSSARDWTCDSVGIVAPLGAQLAGSALGLRDYFCGIPPDRHGTTASPNVGRLSAYVNTATRATNTATTHWITHMTDYTAPYQHPRRRTSRARLALAIVGAA